MSRHGYTDSCDLDQWEWIMWRGRVASATRGKRGQRMLVELRDALDAMPDKRLIAGDLVEPETGECCTIGAALLARKGAAEAKQWDADGNNDALAAEFDVAECLIQEIEWENDEAGFDKTPEGRWVRMRAWVEGQIKEAKDE